MKDFWQRVKSLLDRDLNRAWLSEEIGVPTNTFSNWLARDFDPKLSKALAIADALGVSVEYLATGKESYSIDDAKGTTGLSPQAEHLPQSTPFYNVDLTYSNMQQIQDQTLQPTENLLYTSFAECDFCIRAMGDSMIPKIIHGDIVALQKLQNLREVLWGEIYVILTFEESKICALKLLFQDPENSNAIILRSLNPTYPGDKVLQKSAIKDIYKVVGSLRQFG